MIWIAAGIVAIIVGVLTVGSWALAKPVILWHPNSPGVKVKAYPSLLRHLKINRSEFATWSEVSDSYSAKGAERAIADQIRRLEKEMGIGPFAGKEKWCEPTEPCGHRDHGPIDEETGLWEPDYSPRPSRFLFAENPETIVAKQYVMGQLPDVPDVLDFKIKEKTPDELPLAEALGDYSVTYARGFAETPSPPCHDPYHDHHEIRSLRGAVLRACVPRL